MVSILELITSAEGVRQLDMLHEFSRRTAKKLTRMAAMRATRLAKRLQTVARAFHEEASIMPESPHVNAVAECLTQLAKEYSFVVENPDHIDKKMLRSPAVVSVLAAIPAKDLQKRRAQMLAQVMVTRAGPRRRRRWTRCFGPNAHVRCRIGPTSPADTKSHTVQNFRCLRRQRQPTVLRRFGRCTPCFAKGTHGISGLARSRDLASVP